MKASEEFILREIAGEYMLVPVGQAAARFNGLIAINEIGSFLFQALGREQTEDSLVDLIVKEYDIDRETARNDLQSFLTDLRQLGALIEA